MMPDSRLPDKPLQPFLENFDCFGWVPTIRGCLSLSFVNQDNVWGDTDKYAITFKTFDKFNPSPHYLVASSLISFNDSKAGMKYSRVFRYIFIGTINDKNKEQEFIHTHFNNANREAAERVFAEKELLIGRLYVVLKFSKNLTEHESGLLETLEDLTKEKEKYDKAFHNDAVVCSVLEAMRENLKSKWETAEDFIDCIETDLESNTKKREKDDHLYKFDVVLSRDGILFLKDASCDNFKDDYFTANSPDDYTQNIPIPRIFKTAIHFIKFLFHKNYYHNEEDDTFLPASNLHHIRNEKGWTERINRHQLEAFLTPITKIKRANNTCNPSGIALYAKSFLNVLEKNNLISSQEVAFEQKFVETQKQEVEEYLSERKARQNSFIAQKNWVTRFTVGFAFLTAGIGITNYLFNDCVLPRLNNLNDIFWSKYQRPLLVVVCFITGVLLHYVIYNLKKNRFVQKKIRRSFLNKNSDTKKKRFSTRYKIRLLIIEIKIFFGLYYMQIIISLYYCLIIGLLTYLLIILLS